MSASEHVAPPQFDWSWWKRKPVNRTYSNNVFKVSNSRSHPRCVVGVVPLADVDIRFTVCQVKLKA